MPNTPIEQKIWNALKARIVAAQASGQLLDYVKEKSFYEGIRDTVPSGAFPVIVMEVDSATEEPHTIPQRILMRFNFNFTCAIEHIDKDKQIIGDGTVRGIMDIANDMKNVLAGSFQNKLGLGPDGVLRVRFPNTQYFIDDYPIRQAVITVEVEAQIKIDAR